MAKLTEADKRAFARQVVEVLRQNTARLSGAGFDASSRVISLEGKAHEAEVKEAAQLDAQQAALRATDASNTATDEIGRAHV